MKSRQRFFNPAVFRKDVTRFAPAWVLYTVMLLCFLFTGIASRGSVYDKAWSARDMITWLPILNLGYALLAAWLLFGDLFQPRLCNALHALPMRRECWLVTHAAAGLAFALVPYLISASVMASLLGEAAVIAAWWLLAAVAEYLFFFGAAVLAAMCTGNRIGMLLAYAIINFLSILVYALVDLLYMPLLYGLRTQEEVFKQWCPAMQMADLKLVTILSEEFEQILPSGYYTSAWRYLGAVPGEGWGYVSLCAGLGAAMLGISIILYRRRKLECAGDFAAFRAVQPVFLVCYTLAAGLFMQTCVNVFGYGVGSGTELVFFAIGIVLGFFTGLMLLGRTTHIFTKRAFAGFGLLTAVLLASLVLTYFDVAGLTRRVPQLAEVESVTVNPYFYSGNEGVTLTQSADIQKILDLHRRTAAEGDPERSRKGTVAVMSETAPSDVVMFPIRLDYTLTDGSTLHRYYEINAAGKDGDVLRPYFSSVKCVLGAEEGELEALARSMTEVTVWFGNEKYRTEQFGDAEITNEILAYMPLGLLEAIAADCRAGNMAQDQAFHVNDDEPWHIGSVEWLIPLEGYGGMHWQTVYIYPSCENTIRWLTENELPTAGSVQKCDPATGEPVPKTDSGI